MSDKNKKEPERGWGRGAYDSVSTAEEGDKVNGPR